MAALVQVVMLMSMIAAAVFFTPFAAGVFVCGCLLLFSITRGEGSGAFQDVTGKTIPRSRRGRLPAARSMIDAVDTSGRATWVVFANSTMRRITLVNGLLGGIAQVFGLRAFIGFLMVLGVLGAAAGSLLPETICTGNDRIEFDGRLTCA